MQEKRCRRCGETKPFTEFHRCPRTPGGRQAQCRACRSKQAKERRAANLESARERQREANRAYRRNNPTTYLPQQQQWKRENAEKVKAHDKLNDAVRRGKIKRPDRCENCGAAKPDGHHDDYSKPLDVRWLCRVCHSAVHRELETEAA